MHSTHTDADNIGVMIAGFIALAFVYALLQFIGRLFQPKPAEVIDDEAIAWAQAKSTLKPRQLPDGQWVEPMIKWEPCKPPMGDAQLLHFPMDPEHRKNCQRCQQEYQRGSRMPHAPN